MGSIFSRRNKRGNTKKFENGMQTQAWTNNASNIGSTQSLSPNQGQYSELEQAQPLTRPHSLGDLRDRSGPSSPTQIKPPSVSHKKYANEDEEMRKKKERKKMNGKNSKESHTPGSDKVYAEINSGPKVRADRDYEANYDSAISFRKGDILQLINERNVDGWYFARNLRTGEEGNVPTYWVTMITPAPVESQTCFFKGLQREEAVERLREPGIELGTYLLRPSEDGYALSLRCENELHELEIRHYKIRVIERGICYIDVANNKPFSNIVELIQYYTEEPGLRCKLNKPLPQDIPLEDLAVKFSDLKLGEKLGSGNYGSVYAGTLHGNKQVAVKSLRTGSSMTVEEFRQEAETMHKLRHPKLVSLLAICEGNDKIYIITERMSKGALLNLLREDIDNTIKFKDLMDMAIQVAEGMCYLEKKAFVHRDLRAANVVVGDRNIAKIADFGLARLLDSYYGEEDYYKSKKGAVFPYKWTALEAANLFRFTVKSDVWSFGILLFEMVTHGVEPYTGMENHEVIRWLDKGNRLEKPAKHYCPLALYNIMYQCWLENSGERPNFAYIKENLIEIKTNG